MKRAPFVWMLIAALSAAAAPAAQRTPAPSASAVVSRVRAAVGYDRLRESAAGFVAGGAARHNGVDATFQLAFAPDGRFALRVDGPLGGATGFDGSDGWAVDWSGMPRTLELEDLDEEQLATWAYVGRWLDADAPFDVGLDAGKSDARRVALSLDLRSSPLAATLYVDRATWLPSSVVRRSESGDEVMRLEEYRVVSGFRFPFRLTRTLGKVTDRFEVRSLEPAAGGPDRLFARPAARPDDTRFRDGVPPDLEVRRVPSGHMLVRPRVEGRDVGWFILDSGAGAMVIDGGAARRAGLATLGEVHVSGVGGSQTSRFRMGKSFELGPVTVAALRYVELDLAFLTTAFGVTVGGICGYDLFARAVVELDVAGASVRLHDPARFRLEGGTWQELFLSHKHPAARARFEGDRDGLFKLDTGSDQTVTFHTPAVERLGLLEGRRTTPARAGGVGGAISLRAGTLGWFELGGHRFEVPSVRFATGEKGAFADDYLLGNIGNGFLSAFRIVFDYPNKRIAFVPLAPRSDKGKSRR